ncbi:DUF2062 domain-containing protein [Terrihabitans sp. B22-R8]|uniref:DUF2062 domain-containing protein n=1 Tax=Terrihabitans sp. B22-R8 TaxID=3425128 RepID=UPI00403C1043
MNFRRRAPKPISQRMQDLVWPRMGWRRALRYRGLQLTRLSGSPHAVAAGAAAGIFAAFSPLLGLHYLIAAGLAFVMNGSILASAAVTTLANPVTLPLFWAASYEVGHMLIGGQQGFSAREILEQHNWHSVEPFIEPLLMGSVVLGLIFGVTVYVLVRSLVARHHSTKMERIAVRAQQAIS